MLRLQVECPFEVLHVDGHREMLMGNHPLAADLAEADSRAQPDIRIFSACPLSSESIEAAAESHAIASRYGEVANLVANRTLERGEPIRPVLSVRDCSLILQRRREVEHQDV